MAKIDITGGKMSGPMYGEHFTSDRRNQPWHRPPDITNIDAGIVAAMNQLSSKQSVYGLLTTLQMGVTVVEAATMFVISGVGVGKWTVDTGLLLAGPVAKLIQIMADSAKIDYQMGLEDAPIPTAGYYKGITELNSDSVSFAMEAAQKEIKSVTVPANLQSEATQLASELQAPATPAKGGFASRTPIPNTPSPMGGM